MRADDGSQAWLDEMMRLRRAGISPVAQKQQVQTVDPNTIQDPVLREQMLKAQQAGIEAKKRYEQAWHVGPAHMGGVVGATGGFAIDADVDQMTSAVSQKLRQFGEADSTDAALQQLPHLHRQRAAMVLDALQNGRKLNEVGGRIREQVMSTPQAAQGARLLEGHPCYRPMQTGGFGSPVVLARVVGQVNQQLAASEVVVKGMVSVYVVPPNQTTVDMNMVQRNPGACTQLVEVQTFHHGTLLVPRAAIGTGAQQRTVLTDARQRTGKTILRG